MHSRMLRHFSTSSLERIKVMVAPVPVRFYGAEASTRGAGAQRGRCGNRSPGHCVDKATGAIIRVRDRAPASVKDPAPSRPGSFNCGIAQPAAQCGSARLLNVSVRGFLRSQELRIFPVPGVLACAEWTELPRKRARASDELLGVGLQSHEHVVTGQPAPGDDLGHRILQLVSTAKPRTAAGTTI